MRILTRRTINIVPIVHSGTRSLCSEPTKVSNPAHLICNKDFRFVLPTLNGFHFVCRVNVFHLARSSIRIGDLLFRFERGLSGSLNVIKKKEIADKLEDHRF